MRSMLVATCLVLCGAAWAQPASPPAAKGTRPAKKSRIDRSPKRAGPERPVNIVSQSFEVPPGGRQGVWKGDVLVERDDFKLRCDTLTAELGEDRKPKRVTCSGSVHIVQKPKPGVPQSSDREAWGDVAVYDTSTGVVTLTGKPRARDGKSTMRAEKVSLYLEEDRMVADKPEFEIETARAAPAGKPAAAKTADPAPAPAASPPGQEKP